MLVLSRKVGETINIGDRITLEIRRVAAGRVTIAVEAPREIRIVRGELLSQEHACRMAADKLERDKVAAVDESPDGGRFLWARRKRGSGSLDVLYVVGASVWSLRWHGPARLEEFDVLGGVAPPAISHLPAAHDAVEGT